MNKRGITVRDAVATLAAFGADIVHARKGPGVNQNLS